jgi:hypothetical protein
MQTPAVLDTQKAAHGHLAAVYDKIQTAASRLVAEARAPGAVRAPGLVSPCTVCTVA